MTSAEPGRGTLLIVEDDESMAVALRDGFELEGYSVRSARDGLEALEMVAAHRPDLIVLDVMLPRLSGLDVCRRLRADGRGVPILLLTARGQEIDKVLGLELGADDYVTKPFSFLELATRVKALLRRASGQLGTPAPSTYSFGDVCLDFERHGATKGGEPLQLTARELRMLELFVRRRGAVVTRDQLLDEVWGYDAIPFTRTVDSHIAKLRKKIEAR
ncbi:MAG: response regulator transcription factor, partial [Holophagales bacterium]|nr:response regulator transcription factor [Holophagales bacterium]